MNGVNLFIYFNAIIALFLFGCLSTSLLLDARELELTNDWQLVGENETLPKGAHIKIDLSTGQKLAKLAVDVENQETTGNNDDSNHYQTTQAIQVDAATGEQQKVASSSSLSSISLKNVQETDEITTATTEYNFDLMYQALSKLPLEEFQRMGLENGLPAPPPLQEDRNEWEQKMLQIWQQRQDELQHFQEDVLADLPQILKDRIASIQKYLQNPQEHLQQLLQHERQKSKQHDDQLLLLTIKSVLQDLEFQLSDVDMARDFYTLGGWPLLSSLVSNHVHYAGGGGNSTALNENDFEYARNIVQQYAAWAIGTAVKNTQEFEPLAIQSVVVLQTVSNDKKNGDDGTQSLTPVLLVLEQLAPLQNDDLTMDTSSFTNKRHKMMYALGSLLRGNYAAQLHFCRNNGPLKLVQYTQQDEGNEVDVKLTSRVLALLGDIVTFLANTQEAAEETKEMLQAFTSLPVCNHVVSTLSSTKSTTASFIAVRKFQETAIHTLGIMAPYCNTKWTTKANEIVKSIREMETEWQSRVEDEDVLRDLLTESSIVTKKITGSA